MFWNIPSVTISSLQRTTKPLTDNEIVCVYKQSEPAFFTVKPEKMKELLHDQERLIQAVKEGRLVSEGL